MGENKFDAYRKATEEWQRRCNKHDKEIGVIGRFFEKLFGDNGWSRNEWNNICEEYNINEH